MDIGLPESDYVPEDRTSDEDKTPSRNIISIMLMKLEYAQN